MSLEIAKKYLEEHNMASRIMTFEVSSATVELAAQAIGTEPARIAKSLTFKVGEQPIMIVCAGDAKVNNAKYKAYFEKKATMLTREEVALYTGHEVGGVCPFGVPNTMDIYLDISLKRFDTIYPACGDDHSAVKLTCDELANLCKLKEWIDVCVY